MTIIVVIVTYNGIKWIDRCLSSLRNSSLSAETLVIDNGSTDGSQLRIKENYPEVKFLQCRENLGFGQANNIGIKVAVESGADYVFLLNQDAWIEKDTLRRLVESFSENSQYGIISPMHLNGTYTALDYDFARYISSVKCPGLISDIYLNQTSKKIYEVDFVNAAAWLISRDCLMTVGGFNPIFYHYGEDINYIHRVKYHGLKVGINPTAIICHDRENRQKSMYKSDYRKTVERWSLIHFSHPLKGNTMAFKFFYKKVVETFFSLSLPKLITVAIVLVHVASRYNKIAKNRSLSRERSPSFLYSNK